MKRFSSSRQPKVWVFISTCLTFPSPCSLREEGRVHGYSGARIKQSLNSLFCFLPAASNPDKDKAQRGMFLSLSLSAVGWSFPVGSFIKGTRLSALWSTCPQTLKRARPCWVSFLFPLRSSRLPQAFSEHPALEASFGQWCRKGGRTQAGRWFYHSAENVEKDGTGMPFLSQTFQTEMPAAGSVGKSGKTAGLWSGGPFLVLPLSRGMTLGKDLISRRLSFQFCKRGLIICT